MAENWHAGTGRLLSLAETAELLGQSWDDVLADAAAGNLTWVTAGGVTLYPEDVARALAARRNPPADDPLISRAQAAGILGVGRSAASKHLARDPAAAGGKAYRLSAVLALKAQRDASPRKLSPEHKAALLAAQRAARA